MNREKNVGFCAAAFATMDAEAYSPELNIRVKKGLYFPKPFAGFPYPGYTAVIAFAPGTPKLLKGPCTAMLVVKMETSPPVASATGDKDVIPLQSVLYFNMDLAFRDDPIPTEP